MVKEIICWSPVLTDHLSFTISSLANKIGYPITCFTSRKWHKTRRAQGWFDAEVSGIRRLKLPTVGFFIYSIMNLIKHKNAVHVFGSPFEDKRLFFLIFIAVRFKIKVYLIAESYSPIAQAYLVSEVGLKQKLKSFFRPLIYKFYIGLISKNLIGIFAISALACEQYQYAGLHRKKIFPFGYFVPLVTSDIETKPRTSGALSVVFVGSLIPIKGLDTLISAIQEARTFGVDIELDVYGPGNPRDFNFDTDGVEYKGVIPFGETQLKLVNYDVMVLPSNYDGWGVVVNEAILAQVPVFCSEKVGARTLVEKLGVGEVFPVKNSKFLSRLLIRYANDLHLLSEMKEACIKAVKTIQPEAAACYMYDVMDAQLNKTSYPTSPWYLPKE